MVDVLFDAIAGISPAEVGEVELYHPKSWWTRYGGTYTSCDMRNIIGRFH